MFYSIFIWYKYLSIHHLLNKILAIIHHIYLKCLIYLDLFNFLEKVRNLSFKSNSLKQISYPNVMYHQHTRGSHFKFHQSPIVFKASSFPWVCELPAVCIIKLILCIFVRELLWTMVFSDHKAIIRFNMQLLMLSFPLDLCHLFQLQLQIQ